MSYIFSNRFKRRIKGTYGIRSAYGGSVAFGEPIRATEYEHQVEVVNWLKNRYPDVLFCASAGGLRTNWKQAKRMKSMGYKAGFPDLFIYETNLQYKGLAIELKRDTKSKPSIEQKEWIDELLKRGYYAKVCYGAEEAKREIEAYLNL